MQNLTDKTDDEQKQLIDKMMTMTRNLETSRDVRNYLVQDVWNKNYMDVQGIFYNFKNFHHTICAELLDRHNIDFF